MSNLQANRTLSGSFAEVWVDARASPSCPS